MPNCGRKAAVSYERRGLTFANGNRGDGAGGRGDRIVLHGQQLVDRHSRQARVSAAPERGVLVHIVLQRLLVRGRLGAEDLHSAGYRGALTRGSECSTRPWYSPLARGAPQSAIVSSAVGCTHS